MCRKAKTAISCRDVFWDSIGWSGRNSTLEALASGLPVVTMPSGLMRGRHSLAILSMMGLTSTMAHGLEEYIHAAVSLGRQGHGLEQARAEVLACRDKAYADNECARATENFLVSALAQAGGS